MDLSILDQVPVSTSGSARESLENAVSLAQLAEELGYRRIWFSEHHGATNLASSAPEIIVAHVASKTNTIHVGTGGIMMMHYSPLKIVETFKTLEVLHPGRIDLGVGRAPGGDRNAIFALSQGKAPNLTSLYDKIDVMQDLLLDKQPQYEVYQHTPATPESETVPAMWLLGSSGDSAMQAATKGMGYSYAQFFSGKLNPEAFEIYNVNFKPSPFMEKKKLSVAFYAMVCETKEEAEYYSLPYLISRMNLMRGLPMGKMLTPEEAANQSFSEMDRLFLKKVREGLLIGTPESVATELREYGERYQIDEAMIVTFADPQEVRQQSYRYLAQEFNLQKGGSDL